MYFRAAFAAFLFLISYPAMAQVELVFDPTNRSGPIVVKAMQASFERDTGITRFQGNVVVTQGGMKLTCDDAVVKTAFPEFSEIESIAVEGNVVMQNNRGSASAAYGTFFVQQGELRLRHNVLIRTDTYTLGGEEYVYNLDTGVSSISGNAAADLKISEQ